MFIRSKEKEKVENYEIMESFGFFRPNKNQRKKINDFYQKKNIIIHGRGYDLIDKKTFENVENLYESPILYELKSTWRENINDDFSGFTFGITQNEILNFKSLKQNFKIIYLNGLKKIIKIEDFESIQNCFSHKAYFFTIGKNKNINLENESDLFI